MSILNYPITGRELEGGPGGKCPPPNIFALPRLESPWQVVYNPNPALDSCFEAQIPQKFEDLWGKSLALKNILGF